MVIRRVLGLKKEQNEITAKIVVWCDYFCSNSYNIVPPICLLYDAMAS